MKKLLLIIIVIIAFFSLNNKGEEIIIPKEAIRFRVIANSNSTKDQKTKLLVRNKIEKQLVDDLKNTTNKETAKTILKNNINNYNNLVNSTLKENNVLDSFNINYGQNYFPEKVYKGVKYQEGYYESLVVTLGNGAGDNWWCVLFPPLCLLEAEETEETTEVEYHFFIKDILDKYF